MPKRRQGDRNGGSVGRQGLVKVSAKEAPKVKSPRVACSDVKRDLFLKTERCERGGNQEA